MPGAAEALSALRDAGPLRLVTNTTMRPRRSILERLERLGIEADPTELITPATLAARRCEERGYGSVSLVVLDDLREDLEGIAEGEGSVEAVIVGDLGDGLGLRGPEPRLPAGDGGSGADRPAEEPLLADLGGTVPRRGALRRGDRVRDRPGGGCGGKAGPVVLRARAFRTRRERGPGRDGRRRRRGGRGRRDGRRARRDPGPHREVSRGSGPAVRDRADRDRGLDRGRSGADLRLWPPSGVCRKRRDSRPEAAVSVEGFEGGR